MLKKSWPFILLAVLSFTLHFAFLSYPSQVVFDEVHFGKFVAAYSTGQYYFDIHPPLGKLLIAGFVKLTGANPVFDFSQIGENIPDNTLFILRFLPAFFGSLFVLFFSWLTYLISRSKSAALIAGFLILLDNAFLVQSKFILVDIFMLSFEILTLCFFFLWQRQKNFDAKWFGYLALTGIFAGLTISVKWTGAAVIGIMGVVLLAKVFSEKLHNFLLLPFVKGGGEGFMKDSSALITPGPRMTNFSLFKEFLTGSTILLFISLLVYLLPFRLHFQLLQSSGPGDAFMSQTFQQELKYGRANVYQPLTFWQKFLELNKTMFTASAGLTAEHPFGSKWPSWPFNVKAIYYWNQDAIAGFPGWQARIYFSGNPVLWWLAGLTVILTLLSVFFKKLRHKLSPALYILLLAYFANLLPFIFVSRVAFLYHYLASAAYAILILGLLLDRWLRMSKAFFWTTIIIITASFAITAPLSYGWPLPLTINQAITNFINVFN